MLPALESVLALPPGTLSSLVRHPGPRTRSDAPSILAEGGLWPDPARVSSLLGQVDTRWDHRLTRISQHDRVLVNADRTEHSLWSMQVLRAIVDGPDRWVAVVHRVDEPACPPPVVTGLRNCHLGRLVHDRESGLLATELLFDRPLMRGETLITEHLLTFGRPAPLAFHYERKLPYRVRMYTQEVCFASSARPRRIRSLSRPATGSAGTSCGICTSTPRRGRIWSSSTRIPASMARNGTGVSPPRVRPPGRAARPQRRAQLVATGQQGRGTGVTGRRGTVRVTGTPDAVPRAAMPPPTGASRTATGAGMSDVNPIRRDHRHRGRTVRGTWRPVRRPPPSGCTRAHRPSGLLDHGQLLSSRRRRLMWSVEGPPSPVNKQ